MNLLPQKIMHLIATDFYGGPEKQIVEHLNHLDNKAFQGEVASFIEDNTPNELLERARDKGLSVHGIGMSSPLDLRAQIALIKLIKKAKIDLLCVHGYKACVMGWIAGKWTRIPVLAFSRGYTTENKKVAFYEWVERIVLPRMNGIITVSEGQKKKLEDLGVRGPQKWVVYNAVNVNGEIGNQNSWESKREILEVLDIPLNAKLVVTAGRLSPEKGHRYLVDAIALMRDQVEGVYFVFCGEGECRQKLEKMAKALGVSDNCRFPGFRRDLPEIFKVMDLFVLPSLTEGLPNVILEAFACAKPVVATRVGGVPEIVEDRSNGLLIPAKNPEFLSKAVIQLLLNSEMRASMGKSGYRKVKSGFNFESQAEKLQQIYREILREKRP
jgi:glycosyltransferase involved in cell wall biosynthesis